MPDPHATPGQVVDVYAAAMNVALQHRKDPAGPDTFLAVGQLLRALNPIRPAVEHERARRRAAAAAIWPPDLLERDPNDL